MFDSLNKRLFPKKRRSLSPDIRRSTRLTLEALEDRILLSTPPVIFTTLQDQSGSTINTAQAVPLAPMMESRVTGSLVNSLDVDVFRVNLTQGEIFTADVSTSSGIFRSLLGLPPGHPGLSLLNRLGTPVAASPTGNSQSLEYRVPQSDTYYLDLSWRGTASSQAVPYELDLRPIGLNNGSLDPSYLANSNGGLYAWLDGNLLDVSGPVGHGFSIRGNWTETVSYANTLPSATYMASGTVYLETPGGEVPVSLPSGTVLSVTTQPRLWGDSFGEIGSVNWSTPPSLTTIEAVLGALYPSALVSPGILNQGTVGIALGNDPVLHNTGAPLNPAIPYVYYSLNGGVSQVFTIVFDPADPFLYIGSPLSPLSGLAASQNGLIPFTPVASPSQWHGTLHGHLFIQGNIDIAALTGVPAAFKGSLTLNLDPDHSGYFWANPQDSALLAAAFLDPTQLSSLVGVDQVFQHFSAGLNGELDIAPFDKIKDALPNAVARWAGESHLGEWILSRTFPRFLTVAQASLIYDGPTLSTYFHGGTSNPFDGTPLATFASPATVQLDAAIKPSGAFFLDVSGGYNVLGLNASGEVRLENKWPTILFGPAPTVIYASNIYADLNVNVLGAVVDVHGLVQSNGDFDLAGTGSFNFSGLSGSANFDLNYTSTTGFSFTALAEASYQQGSLGASLVLSFTFGVDSAGHVTYSGSGTASVSLGICTGSVGVGINNSEIWFYFLGTRYDIYYTW